jgi:hypothetical protein
MENRQDTCLALATAPLSEVLSYRRKCPAALNSVYVRRSRT